jgi:hypothetical protein
MGPFVILTVKLDISLTCNYDPCRWLCQLSVIMKYRFEVKMKNQFVIEHARFECEEFSVESSII